VVVYGRERLVSDEHPRRVDPFAVHDRLRSLALGVADVSGELTLVLFGDP
jgi:hypothetical protein